MGDNKVIIIYINLIKITIDNNKTYSIMIIIMGDIIIIIYQLTVHFYCNS